MLSKFKVMLVLVFLLAGVWLLAQPLPASATGSVRVDANAPRPPHDGLRWPPRAIHAPQATLTVDTALDESDGSCSDGDCSLRDAIALANPGDTILFAGDYTIYLSSTLAITQQLTIDGSGRAITVSGDTGNDGSPNVRVFEINAGAVVTLSHLSVVSGTSATGDGGGILNNGVLTVISSTLSGNSANYGGGIYNAEILAVLNSTLSGNSSVQGGGGIWNSDNSRLTVTDSTLSGNETEQDGGGIFNWSGALLTVTHSTLSGNSAAAGGGILNSPQGTLIVISSTLSGNSASDVGGGLVNRSGALLTVTHSILSNNSIDNGEGGGIYNEGTLTVQKSTLSGNSAQWYGGISNRATLMVQDSTLSGNSGEWYGGGMGNFGTLTVQNSTLSGNSAIDYGTGGGIYNEGTLTLTHSTLSGNSAENGEGGGIYNAAGSTLHYTGTIIANSSSGGDCVNAATIGAHDYNLVEDGSCGAVLSGDPRLGPLAANGGDTLTHALLPNSPAIDAGDPAHCPATGQRGEPRTDLRCDVGAFELQHADSDTVLKSGMVAGATASFGPTFISVTVTGGDAGAITATKHLTAPGGVHSTGELTATWWLTASQTPYTLTLALCYTADESAHINDEESLRAFRWDAGTQTWTTPISTSLTVYTTTHCVQLTGITEFSAWTLKDVSVGDETPTAARIAALAARGLAPTLVSLLALAGAATVKRKRI